VVTHNFKSQYDGIQWRNDEDFKDGVVELQDIPWLMQERQLNETGYMHNRVRMVVVSCKHLLIQWQGEAYLLPKNYYDCDMSAVKRGNW
jgi:deoxyribodipyrimidine photo-lyase